MMISSRLGIKFCINMCTVLTGLFTLLIIHTSGANAGSPSFNCGARLTSNERLICSRNDLSNLDVEITNNFLELTSMLNRGAADLVRGDQRRWLKQRQKCSRRVSCTRNKMYQRLDELADSLSEQRTYRNQNNAPKIRGQLPNGLYGIYVLSHEDSLRLDHRGDKKLYTENISGDRNASKQSFRLTFHNGSYIITDIKSGLRLHADGNGDWQVSVRYNPKDDFTKFRLTPANDGCYFVQTVASANYWIWEPNSHVIHVRPQNTGEESMFCFMKQ